MKADRVRNKTTALRILVANHRREAILATKLVGFPIQVQPTLVQKSEAALPALALQFDPQAAGPLMAQPLPGSGGVPKPRS